MDEQKIYESIAKGFIPEKSVSLVHPALKNPIALTLENFHPLPPSVSADMLYVDGGEGILVDNGAQAVALLRVAGVCYNRSRLWHERTTFLSSFQKTDGGFSVHLHCLEGTPLTPQLSVEGQTMEEAVNNARHALEILFASHLLDKKVDVLVLDGALGKNSSALREASEAKGVLLCALAKTSHLLTSAHHPIASTLLRMRPVGTWWYGPLSAQGSTSFVRLSSSSPFCFRLDVHGHNVTHVVASLQPHCNDPVFFGYPYGLIEADSLARVSHQEIEQARMRLELALEKSGIDLQSFEGPKHRILDRIKF